MRLASESFCRPRVWVTAAPTIAASVLRVSISPGDHSRSLRQASKPMKPHHRPSTNTGTATVDLMPPNSKKSAHGLFEVPGVSRDDLTRHESWQPRHEADLDHGSVSCIIEDGRRRYACRAPPIVTDDTAHVDGPDRIDRQQVHSIEIGSVADILKHLRNRARHVAGAQQFFRASGDGLKAACRVDRLRASREIPPSADDRVPLTGQVFSASGPRFHRKVGSTRSERVSSAIGLNYTGRYRSPVLETVQIVNNSDRQ